MAQLRDFGRWKAAVDRELINMVSMTSDDLGDIDYYSCYAVGMTPQETARLALEENGFGADFEEAD